MFYKFYQKGQEKGLDLEFLYLAFCHEKLLEHDLIKLKNIISTSISPCYFESSNDFVLQASNQFVSAFSTNATQILQLCGLPVFRFEKFRKYKLDKLDKTENEGIENIIENLIENGSR